MGLKFKYNAGDYINGILMLERLDKRKSAWYAKFECPYCGTPFESQIAHIKSGNTSSCGCLPVGVASNNYPKAKVFEDLTGQTFGKWTVISRIGMKSEYSSREAYYQCQCECGTIREIPRSTLKNEESYSCGCSKGVSKGERKIREALQELEIAFVAEKTFSDCLNKEKSARLRFDFYLPDYNCCIEYDGEQHFREVPIFHAKLSENQERDQIKNNYCKNNEIRLIRVSYKQLEKISSEYIYELLFLEGGEPTF